jgi:hypothetical protein
MSELHQKPNNKKPKTPIKIVLKQHDDDVETKAHYPQHPGDQDLTIALVCQQ